MNCRDTERVIDTFFDGELEGRLMRDAAMHITRCKRCESELQDREQIHELLGRAIDDDVSEIDLGQIWQGVAAGIADGGRGAYEDSSAREAGAGGWLRLAAISSRASGVVLGSGASMGEIDSSVGRRRGAARRFGVRHWSLAGAAAIAASVLIATALLRGESPDAPQVARVAPAPSAQRSEPIALARANTSQVKVESIDYSGRSMAMWSEPETDTTVIWLDDSAGPERR